MEKYPYNDLLRNHMIYEVKLHRHTNHISLYRLNTTDSAIFIHLFGVFFASKDLNIQTFLCVSLSLFKGMDDMATYNAKMRLIASQFQKYSMSGLLSDLFSAHWSF